MRNFEQIWGQIKFLSQKDPAAVPPEKCEFPTLFRSFPRSSPDLPGAPPPPELPRSSPPEFPRSSSIFFLKKKPVSDIFHRKLLKMRRPLYQNNRFRTFSIETCAKSKFSATTTAFRLALLNLHHKKTAAAAVHPHIARKSGSIGNSTSTNKLGPYFNLAFLGALCLKALLQIAVVNTDFLQFFLSSGSAVAVVPISH